MKSLIIDTCVFHLFSQGHRPEKWIKYWDIVRSKTKKGKIYYFPILIAEYFSVMFHEKKNEKIKEDIDFFIKSVSAEWINLSTKEAINAGKFKEQFGKLSIVDSVILSVANERNLCIITTDTGLREAAKKIHVKKDWLPLKEIKQ